jgi:hypothetical protein
MDTKQIIDYAAEDNAKDMRDSLYAGIHDRVMQHIDAKKQEIAQNLFGQSQEPQETTGENS